MAADTVATSIRIDAPPEVVFDYFIDAKALMRWMGDYAVVVPERGGEFTVDINGVPVRGRFVDVLPPHRIVVTWGYAGSRHLPPGASTVEIDLHPDGDGTMLKLVHRDLPAAERPQHIEGWRHFLERLSVAAAGGDPGPDPWADDPPGTHSEESP